MEFERYALLESQASAPEMLEQTVSYVAQNLRLFLRPREQVLICFPKGEPNSLGCIFQQAVQRLSAFPVFWSPDHKWKSLLRQAFSTKATVIIGPPLVVLGLAKLAKATATPLYVRHVVTAGYPCLDWMIDGIIRGLDCKTWGCLGPGTGAVISGFSCGKSRGVHIREDAYDVTVLDDLGNPVADGTSGTISIAPCAMKEHRVRFRDHGRIDRSVCTCGVKTARLVDIHPSQRFQNDVLDLYQKFHAWTSILDCRVSKGEYGLELELVVFPGEKLPKLPTCAKQVIRSWDPERDVPLDLQPTWK